MTLYSVESRTRKYVKGYGYLSLAGNLSKKYEKQLLDTASKRRINASKKVIHIAAEITSE